MTPHSFPFQPSFPIAFLAVVLASLAGCFGPGPGWDEHYDLNPYAQLLSATRESPVRIEIHYVEGRQPANSTLEAITTTLEEVNGRGSLAPFSIEAIPVADSSSAKEWEFEELFELASPVDERGCRGIERCVPFFFLNGRYNGTRGYYEGLALAGWVFVFVDAAHQLVRIEDFTVPDPVAGEVVERFVAIHELGHVLGLVGNGVPMREERHPSTVEDPCECHSTHADSVMYYRYHEETDSILERVFQDGTRHPHEFNAADWRDIRAFQADVAAAQA